MRQVLWAFLLASGLSDQGFSRTDVRTNVVSLKRQIWRKMSKRQTWPENKVEIRLTNC